MTMARHKQKGGTFSKGRLPIAASYPLWSRRRAMLWVGGGVGVVLAALAVGDMVWGDARSVSNGPLSAAHSAMEGECSSCHRALGQVEDQRCESCHERFDDPLPIYGLARHVRRGTEGAPPDASVADPDTEAAHRPRDVHCATCHVEHRGRDVSLTSVGDLACAECHRSDSFPDRHPEFAAVVEGATEPEPLLFTHVHHVQEILRRGGELGGATGDGDTAGIEVACRYCHQRSEGGRSFAPIDYQQHCGACHLGAGVATTWLPLAGGADGEEDGVLGLAQLRALEEPWSSRQLDTVAAQDLLDRRGSVRKVRLVHRDPWILGNLRRLRQELYPNAGLADLLTALPSAADAESGALYGEAIDSLQRLLADSRVAGVPESELRDLEARLDAARGRVSGANERLGAGPFVQSLAAPRDDLSAERVAALQQLVADLTAPCRQCHVLESASIAQVPDDQRVMRKAEFDHGSHALQAGCLDCHDRIPIREGVVAAQSGSDVADVAGSGDRAAVLNLPSIATCRRCHVPDLAGASCVSCHRYHPERGRVQPPVLDGGGTP